jgi:outer membrane protein
MRNTITKWTMVVAVLLSPGLLLAQSQNGDDVPQKIAVINIQQAIGATEEGKKALADLQKKYSPLQQDLQQQEKEINALQDRLQNQSSMLSDDEKYQLSRELDTKQRHFKEAQEDARADYQADTQEAIRKIGQKMVKLIDQYAQQHHYALVLSNQQDVVYYVSKAADITQDIVNLYNQTYPVSSASNSPAGSSGNSPTASKSSPGK